MNSIQSVNKHNDFLNTQKSQSLSRNWIHAHKSWKKWCDFHSPYFVRFILFFSLKFVCNPFSNFFFFFQIKCILHFSYHSFSLRPCPCLSCSRYAWLMAQADAVFRITVRSLIRHLCVVLPDGLHGICVRLNFRIQCALKAHSQGSWTLIVT